MRQSSWCASCERRTYACVYCARCENCCSCADDQEAEREVAQRELEWIVLREEWKRALERDLSDMEDETYYWDT